MAAILTKPLTLSKGWKDPGNIDEHPERLEGEENQASMIAYRTTDQMPVQECGDPYLTQILCGRSESGREPCINNVPDSKNKSDSKPRSLALLPSRASNRIRTCHLLILSVLIVTDN